MALPPRAGPGGFLDPQHTEMYETERAEKRASVSERVPGQFKRMMEVPIMLKQLDRSQRARLTRMYKENDPEARRLGDIQDKAQRQKEVQVWVDEQIQKDLRRQKGAELTKLMREGRAPNPNVIHPQIWKDIISEDGPPELRNALGRNAVEQLAKQEWATWQKEREIALKYGHEASQKGAAQDSQVANWLDHKQSRELERGGAPELLPPQELQQQLMGGVSDDQLVEALTEGKITEADTGHGMTLDLIDTIADTAQQFSEALLPGGGAMELARIQQEEIMAQKYPESTYLNRKPAEGGATKSFMTPIRAFEGAAVGAVKPFQMEGQAPPEITYEDVPEKRFGGSGGALLSETVLPARKKAVSDEVLGIKRDGPRPGVVDVLMSAVEGATTLPGGNDKFSVSSFLKETKNRNEQRAVEWVRANPGVAQEFLRQVDEEHAGVELDPYERKHLAHQKLVEKANEWNQADLASELMNNPNLSQFVFEVVFDPYNVVSPAKLGRAGGKDFQRMIKEIMDPLAKNFSPGGEFRNTARALDDLAPGTGVKSKGGAPSLEEEFKYLQAETRGTKQHELEAALPEKEGLFGKAKRIITRGKKPQSPITDLDAIQKEAGKVSQAQESQNLAKLLDKKGLVVRQPGKAKTAEGLKKQAKVKALKKDAQGWKEKQAFVKKKTAELRKVINDPKYTRADRAQARKELEEFKPKLKEINAELEKKVLLAEDAWKVLEAKPDVVPTGVHKSSKAQVPFVELEHSNPLAKQFLEPLKGTYSPKELKKFSVLVPNEVATYVNSRLDGNAPSWMGKIWGNMMNTWKMGVTVAVPAFAGVNAIGAQTMYYLNHGIKISGVSGQAGGLGLALANTFFGGKSKKFQNARLHFPDGSSATYAEVVDEMRRLNVFGKSASKLDDLRNYDKAFADPQNWMESLANLGTGATAITAKMTSGATKALLLQPLNRMIDDFQHAAAYMTALDSWSKAGKVKAYNHMLETSAVYNAYNRGIDQAGRNLFSFYSWNRFWLENVTKAAFEHPERLTFLRKLVELGASTRTSDGTDARYPIPGTETDLGKLLGQYPASKEYQPSKDEQLRDRKQVMEYMPTEANVLGFMDQGTSQAGILKFVADNMNPLIKGAVMALTGIDPQDGRPVERMEGFSELYSFKRPKETYGPTLVKLFRDNDMPAVIDLLDSMGFNINPDDRAKMKSKNELWALQFLTGLDVPNPFPLKHRMESTSNLDALRAQEGAQRKRSRERGKEGLQYLGD